MIVKRNHHCAGMAIFLALLIVAGSVTADASDRFERIREKAAELAVAVNRAQANPLTDGKDSEMEKAYGGYAYLLTPAKLEEIRALVGAVTDPAEKARRERTAAILNYHAVHARVAPVMDNFRNALKDNSIPVDEGTVRIFALDQRLGLEEDRNVRRKWWLAASQLYTAINVYQRSVLTDLDTEARTLGYAGYYPFLRALEGWDLELIRATAESFLEGSQGTYEEQLAQWAQRELGLEVRKMRTYDADRMLFFSSLSEEIKRFDPEEIAEKTFKEFGFRLDKQQTLKVNLRDKKNKLPCARAFRTQAGKAEVTMIPSERVTDVQDLLGALGEAEFYYLTPGDLPFEDAYTGTNVIPSVYGALIEMICEEPAWVTRHLKLNGATAEDLAGALRFRRLAKVREAAGNFLFALQLQENPQIDPQVYNDIMETALGWKRIANDQDTYFSSNDDFRSGGIVLGQAIAAQIREKLRSEWGAEWYENKELAARLTRGAAQGYAIGIDEFLDIWGIDALDPSVLTAQLASQ